MTTKNPNRIDRPHIPGQPDCPHTAQEVSNTKELPASATGTCPICMQDWFDETLGQPVIPVVLPCGHAICRSCLTEFRATSLDCYLRCPAPPTNSADCNHCRDWEIAHDNDGPELPPRMYDIVRCVRVDPFPMIEEIVADIDFLTGSSDSGILPLPPTTRTALIDYVTERLNDVQGQLHRHQDLAIILDPFRGTDIDPLEARVNFEPLLAPMLNLTPFGYLAPQTNEPWISTALRSIVERWNDDDAMASENPAWDHGIPNPDSTFDNNGDVIWDWPVERIVDHRFEEDGQIRYRVAYMRFEHPDDHEWVYPQDFRRPVVYQVYNRTEGIQIEETWLEPEEEEAVQMAGEEEMEDSDSDDETVDGDMSGDYVPWNDET